MISERRQKLKRRLATCIHVVSWINLAILAVVAAVIRWQGDTDWPTTLLAFGPRWVALVPAIPLGLSSLIYRRRALVPVTLGTLCAMGPVMGFCVPWRSLLDREPQGAFPLRVVSINADEGTDLAAFFEFVDKSEPDIIAFQESPFVDKVVKGLHENYFFSGAPGVFIASRYKILRCHLSRHSRGRQHFPAVRCDIVTPKGEIHVNCVHLFSLRSGFTSIMEQRIGGVAELERVLAIRNQESALVAGFSQETTGPTLILGDFNTTFESSIFHRDFSGWNDAFAKRGWGFGYTFNTDWIGLRIDHILADREHWYIRECHVGPDLHGQHRPVIAELLLLPE